MSTKSDEKLDPRIKRTRALIQAAFMQLLSEKGFQPITVQDITQRAEINRATFYAHYADKYALLETTIGQIFQQELEKHTLDVCQYSRQNLHALIVTVCEFITRSNAHCRGGDRQFETMVEQQVRDQIQELLETWLVQTGTDIAPKTAATAANWTIYGLVQQWSHEKNRPSPEEYADQILPLIVANLHLKQEEMLVESQS